MERSVGRPSRRGENLTSAPVLQDAARRFLAIVQKIIVVLFSSRTVVWLENRMVAAYCSPRRWVRKGIFWVWFALYRFALLMRTGLIYQIYQMEGVPVGQTEPVRMVYFQAGHGRGYITKELFGENGHQESLLGMCNYMDLSERARAVSADADLVICERNTLQCWLPGRGLWMRTPTWVSMVLEVDPSQPWEVVEKGMRSQKNNIKPMKKKGFTFSISHNPRDFDFFYERMYQPYIRSRYAEDSATDSQEHLRSIFEKGFMAQIHSADGQLAAGMLCMRQGEVLFAVVLGLLDGSVNWLEEGALTAMYYYTIQYGHAQGACRIDFGGVRPFSTNGLYHYKYRWGFRPIPDYWNPREWLLWLPEESGPARRWLDEHPLLPETMRANRQPSPASER